MAPPIVSIVGKSDSGKTTLLEKLIPELSERGYVVGTIKHDAHSFDIDHPGKDSWRHTQAGAKVMVVSSKSQAAMVRRLEGELSLDEIADAYMGPVDIVLTEGFKREAKPKIEVLADGDTDLISPLADLFLVAASGSLEVDVPVVGRDDAGAIADVLEREFLDRERVQQRVELIVDGKSVPLNAIMKAMVSNTMAGLISSLKGGQHPGIIELRLDRRPTKDRNSGS